MVATDERLVGRCAVEEGYARLSCQWHVQVEPERPFRMQEADRRVDYDVTGEEHFCPAGTDMHRQVVTPGATSAPALIRRRRGLANFRFAWVTSGCCLADTLLGSAGSLQKATSVSLRGTAAMRSCRH
jgi:hypothetical protein